MDKQEERIIMEQQKQIEIDKISDLELAEVAMSDKVAEGE